MAEDITRSHERVLFARFILDFDLAQKTVALVAVKNARSLNGEIERQLLRRFRWSSPLLFDVAFDHQGVPAWHRNHQHLKQ
jgi:hypothetical protein